MVSYRADTWLEPCLRSLAGQVDELVLVDNGSADAEVSRIGSRAGARVARSEANTGFSGGVNLGIARAAGDVLCLLNDDAIADPGWVRRAVEQLGDPSVAAVGPKVLLDRSYGELHLDQEPWFAPGDARPLGRRLGSVTVDGREVLGELAGPGVHRIEAASPDAGAERWRWTSGSGPVYVPEASPGSTVRVDGEPVPVLRTCTLVNSAGIYLRPDGASGDYGLLAEDDGRFDDPAERFGLSGVALAVRAETVRRFGAMAAPYFTYYEDVDWAWRMRLAGLRLVYDPGAVVRHHRAATSGGVASARSRFLAERNRLLTIARNGPTRTAAGLVRRGMREDTQPGVRRAVRRMLPWALWTRAVYARHRTCSPGEVWARWAGADLEWGAGEGTSWA